MYVDLGTARAQPSTLLFLNILSRTSQKRSSVGMIIYMIIKGNWSVCWSPTATIKSGGFKPPEHRENMRAGQWGSSFQKLQKSALTLAGNQGVSNYWHVARANNSSCVLELAEPLLGPDQLLTILPLIPFDTIMKVSRRRHHWHPATSIRNNILHQSSCLWAAHGKRQQVNKNNTSILHTSAEEHSPTQQ